MKKYIKYILNNWKKLFYFKGKSENLKDKNLDKIGNPETKKIILYKNKSINKENTLKDFIIVLKLEINKTELTIKLKNNTFNNILNLEFTIEIVHYQSQNYIDISKFNFENNEFIQNQEIVELNKTLDYCVLSRGYMSYKFIVTKIKFDNGITIRKSIELDLNKMIRSF